MNLGLHPQFSSQALCQFGWESLTPTYIVNKLQYKPHVQKKKQTNKKPSRAEQPLTKQMRLQRRPENTCHKKPLWGKNVQEIWVGTKAQAPSDLKPILRRLYKKEIRTADPTGLDAWHLKKKELNKEKLKQNERRKERGWF